MDALTRRVSERLTKYRQCTVFGKEIDKIWPCPPSPAEIKRDAQIHALAANRGWTATIMNPRVRVTFRKLPV